MIKKIRVLLWVLFVVCLFGLMSLSCQAADLQIEEATLTLTKTNTFQVLTPTIAPSATIEPTPTNEEDSPLNHGLHFRAGTYNYYWNWYDNEHIYGEINDTTECEKDYAILPVVGPDTKSIVSSVYAPEIPDELLQELFIIFGEGIEQAHRSPDGDELLIFVVYDECLVHFQESYEVWHYVVSTGQKRLIIPRNSEFQSHCSLYELDPSSVVWVMDSDFVYVDCRNEYGEYLINLKDDGHINLRVDTYGYSLFPNFSPNGEKVIAGGWLLSSSDYLAYLSKCGVHPDGPCTDFGIRDEMIEELREKMILELPSSPYPVNWKYQWDAEGKFYYYLAVGENNDISAGIHDFDINQLYLETGEIKTLLTSDELLDAVDHIYHREMDVSPDGKIILFTDYSLDDNVFYMYSLEDGWQE